MQDAQICDRLRRTIQRQTRRAARPYWGCTRESGIGLGDHNTCPALRGAVSEDQGVVNQLARRVLRQSASMSQTASPTADSAGSHEPHARGSLRGGPRDYLGAGWDQYVAELRGRLDDVYALLSLVDNAGAPA